MPHPLPEDEPLYERPTREQGFFPPALNISPPKPPSRPPRLTVLARVRPFLVEERRGGASGAVTVAGAGRIVVVNPGVFEADPDVVVGVAAAVNRMASGQGNLAHLHCDEWARAFEFDRCFWYVPS